MKLHLFISAFIICQLSCTNESFPPCLIDSDQIDYPFIAHSHNDYDQVLPISTAIDHGFTSLEVDIAFDGLDLRISHDDKNLDEKLEFEESYLLPLMNQEIRDGGVLLLVDIKNYSPQLIDQLNLILNKHECKLVSRSTLNDTEGKIKIVLSGEIHRQEIVEDATNRFLFIDGRLTDFDLNASSDIVPLISLNIADISNSDADNEGALRNVISQVHDQNKMIRFWNTNDKESVWLSLIELQVDILGVDDLEKFCGAMKANGFIN